MNKSVIPKKTTITINSPPSYSPALFSSKNVIIAILVILLILSVLGINLLVIVGYLLQSIVNLIRPIFDSIIGIIFYYIGAAVNVSADVAGDVARTGITIAEGTVHSVGNLLQNEDNVNGPLPQQTAFYKKIFEVIPANLETPSPDYSNNVQQIAQNVGASVAPGVDVAELMRKEVPVPSEVSRPPSNKDLDETIGREQNPSQISAAPLPAWCLVGQYGGKRSCISLEGNEICESGQIYASQDNCLQLQNANVERVVSKPMPVAPTYTRNWGTPPPIPPTAAMSPPMGANMQQIQPPYIPTNYINYQNAPVMSNLPNPYYGSKKYQNIPGISNTAYFGPNAGSFLRPPPVAM